MNLHILEKLDYTLYSDVERVRLCRSLLEEENGLLNVNLENSAEQKQIEGLANFILYGKKENSEKSIVDNKDIFIKPKYGSFQKKEPESLEALQESISFDESMVKPLGTKNIYTKPKQTISRDKDSGVPYMEQLWGDIDIMQYIYDISAKDTSETPDPRQELYRNLNLQKISGLKLYKWRHWLIDVRRHQFYLKDAFCNKIHFINVKPPSPSQIDWTSNSQYSTKNPHSNISELHIVREHTLDFTNFEHIYYLLEYYGELKQGSFEDTVGQMRFILYSLEELIDKTHLAPSRFDILVMKVDKKINKKICEELKLKYGLDYSENYISTIWKQEICRKIAFQADLELDKFNARDYPAAWKKCNCCGELKLRDEREFVKKNTSKDGLSNRCKKCDKKKRDKSNTDI